MKNQVSRYAVIDAGQRNVLLVERSLEVASFVQRSIMDTRIAGISYRNFQEVDALLASTDQLPKLAYSAGTLVLLDNPTISSITREKRERAKLLSQGYALLLWYANAAGERYAYTPSIEFNDLPLLSLNRQMFIDLYVKIHGVTAEQAEKQITFDEQSLRTMVMRRKEILWTYTPKLLALTTQAELDALVVEIRNDTVTVGTV